MEPEELAVARARLAEERAAWEEEAGWAFMPSKDAQELFMAALMRAYERACEALLRDHAALARTEHDNQRVLNNRCRTFPRPSSSDPFQAPAARIALHRQLGLSCCDSRKDISRDWESAVQIRPCIPPHAKLVVTSLGDHACGLPSHDVSQFECSAKFLGIGVPCKMSQEHRPIVFQHMGSWVIIVYPEPYNPRIVRQNITDGGRGELPEEMAAAYEKQHRSFEALQKSLASLAESLEREVPALPETTTRFTGEGGVSLVTRQVCFALQSRVYILTVLRGLGVSKP